MSSGADIWPGWTRSCPSWPSSGPRWPAQRLTMKRVQAIVCTPGNDLADAPMRLHGVLQPRRHVGTLSGEGSASTRYKFARTYGEIW